jgi:hypothetical protein
MTRAQIQELVDTVKVLSKEVVALRSERDDDKKGEKKASRGGDRSRSQAQPPVNPSSSSRQIPQAQAIPMHQGQSSRSTPRSSSGVTPTGTNLSNVNDPSYLHRNFYGINVAGEEPVNSQFLGPRDSIEEIRRKEEEDRLNYDRRVEEEKRNPPRRRRM